MKQYERMNFNWGEVTDEMRDAVLKRDGNKCKQCGTNKKLAIDHIYCRAAGGPTELWNLQVLCKHCNVVKGISIEIPDNAPDDFLQYLKDRETKIDPEFENTLITILVDIARRDLAERVFEQEGGADEIKKK